MRLLLFALTALCLALPASAATPWTRSAALELLDYGRHVDTHGLDPGAYELDRLQAVAAGQDQAALDLAATRSFALLARDLANGRVPVAQRRLSYYRGMDLKPETVPDLIDQALRGQGVAATLEALAPAAPEYRMLRAAFIGLPADARAERAAARVTLERWRWLPRDLGGHYLIVNIPEFLVREMDGERMVAAHRVIVGKLATPTPQFATSVSGVILNPVWRVPQSIIAESVGALVRGNPAEATARGYRWTTQGGGLQVTQAPGPTNSLGQMKLDMPNPLSIYLHDTPSKALFDREVRTFSHGCIRTEKPFDLAARLLAGTDWTPDRIAAAVRSRETVTIPLSRPLPVYIVYLTARAESSGRLSVFADPYKLDAAILSALGADTGAVPRAQARTESECALAGAG